jgi:superfamily II DNA or RNA helicase
MVLFGQYQYSIDREKLKQSRRLTVKEFFENQRQKRNEKRVASEMAKIDKKTDAIARKYEKKKQTEIVRKRMKESRKMAQKFNKGKPPVDFITYIEYKTKKYYGQFF